MNEIGHERIREAIYAEESFAGLDEHLAGCKDCRRLAARLEQIDQAIRETPIPEPSPTLLASILARTSGRRPRSEQP